MRCLLTCIFLIFSHFFCFAQWLSFNEEIIPSNAFAAHIEVADLNLNGLNDIVIGDKYERKVELLRHSATGFTRQTLYSGDAADNYLFDIAIADLNDDGLEDIIACFFDRIYYFTNLGTYNFEDKVSFTISAIPHNKWTDIEVIDWDDDGSLDLIASSGSGKIAIWYGQGDGTFGTIELLATDITITEMRSADVDGDSDLDIIGRSTTQVFLLENIGTTDSISANFLFNVSSNGNDLALSDFDNDGLDDILFQGWDTLCWSKNLGSNIFSPCTALGVGGYKIAVVDIDDDGDQDIITSGDGYTPVIAGIESLQSSILIRENLGGGIFELKPDLYNGLRFWEIQAADIDSDGDMDIVSGSEWGSGVSFFTNITGEPLGVSQLFEEEEVALYPNPVHTKARVKLGTTGIFKVHLSSVDGSVLFLGEFTDGDLMDLNKIESGIYTMTFSKDEVFISTKIIKR